MLQKPKRGLFVTGTDTGVGKTYVAAEIVRSLRHSGHRVGVYKPAESGCHREGAAPIPSDAATLLAASGSDGELNDVCPQAFAAPLAPHLAARAEGREIDSGLLRSGLSVWCDRSDVVIVEGAGGLMSPVSDDEYVADLASDFGYPLIVVAPNQLGTINQTLQTLITAMTFRDGLHVAGIVLNDLAPDLRDDVSVGSNRDELAARCLSPVLTHMQWQGELDEPIDWFELAKMINDD